MGPPGCKSENSVHLEGRLHSPIQKQTSSGTRSFDSQWLCKPPQEPLPVGGFASPTAKGGSRDGEGSNISSLLQQTFHSSQTKPEMAASLGPQCSKQIFEHKNIQNGNPRDNSDFLATRGMGDIAGFQRRLFPHSSSCQVPEISQVPLPKSVLSVLGPSLWPLNSSDGVHLCGQRGQINGSITGYKDPPVPKRLVDSSPYQRILPPGHPIPPCPLSGIGLGGEPTKIGVGTQTGFRTCGLPIRPLTRTGQTDPEPVGIDPPEGAVYHDQPNLSSQALHVANRPAYGKRKTGAPGETPHETHPVAPQTTLEGPRISRERDSSPEAPLSAPSMVDKETNVLPGQPLHPLRHAIQIFTDASKEGWVAHLGDFTASGTWSVPESHLHINFLELKAVLLALKRFQHLVQGKVVLVSTDNTTVVAYINKEGGMRSGSLCALLWRLLCWCNLRQVVLKARHIPGRLNVIADKLSRQGQIIQTEWSLHQEVFNLLIQTWHRPKWTCLQQSTIAN